jgi:hypothetical protein
MLQLVLHGRANNPEVLSHEWSLDPAYAGWEPLVGHGTGWTLLRAALLGEEADLAWWSGLVWSRLAMPDVASYAPGAHPGDMLAP